MSRESGVQRYEGYDSQGRGGLDAVSFRFAIRYSREGEWEARRKEVSEREEVRADPPRRWGRL